MANSPSRIIESVFLQYGASKSYPANHIVSQKGNVADKLYYIRSGQVRTIITNPDGDETTLFYLGAGNIFGSDALTDNPVVVVTIQTITPCDLYVLTAKQFLSIWQLHNYPIQDLFSHYLQRITLLSDYICCSHFPTAKQKIAYFLHSFLLHYGHTIALTNEQIAAVTGVKRISVNRTLNALAQEGILSLEYKKIEILDEERLIKVFNGLGYFLN